MYNDTNVIEKQIDARTFKGLEDIRVGKVLHNSLLDIKRYPELSVGAGNKHLLKTIPCIFTSGISVRKQHKTEIAFVFSNSYKIRQDHLRNYRSISKLLDNTLCIEPGASTLKIQQSGVLRYIHSWNKELEKVENISLSSKKYLLFNLVDAYMDAYNVINICKKNSIKHINVFSDSHPIDNLIVQMAKKTGISTSTVQHGLFLEEGYLNSVSDYFLAWGEQSRERAIAMGIAEESIKLVGMPQLINHPVKNSMIKSKNNRIALICSSPEHDPLILEILKEYASKYDKKIWVKLHPGTKSNIITGEQIEKVITDELSVYDIVDFVDAAITAKSTVFVEYLVQLFPVFLYETDDARYEKMDWCKFTDSNGFEELMKKISEDSEAFKKQMISARSYYTLTDNIASEYRAFFNSQI